MPHKKLNARNVQNLAPRRGRSQDYWWDTTKGAAGFGVRVSAQSEGGDVSRTFVLFYRIHGRQRFLKLGSVGAVGLADARELAKGKLLEVEGGKDPQARKTELRESESVASLVAAFIARAKTKRGREKADATKRFYSQMLRAELEGTDLGRASLATVTADDVRAHLDRIGERAPVLANRFYQLVKAAFAWGVLEGLVPIGVDPLRTVREPKPEAEVEGDHVVSADELRLLWPALDALDDEGKRLLSPSAAAAVRVTLLLGTRRGETLRMRRKDLDLEAQRWSIPGEFRKGGEPLTVPLAPQVVAILEGLPKVKGAGAFVFAGRDGASLLTNPGRLGAAIRACVKAEVKAQAKKAAADGGKGPKIRPFTLHDLRRTCATGVGELGAPPHVVALILGHKTMPGWGNVTAVYDRSQRARDVAPFLNAWAAHVERVVSGEERKGADVLPMRRA